MKSKIAFVMILTVVCLSLLKLNFEGSQVALEPVLVDRDVYSFSNKENVYNRKVYIEKSLRGHNFMDSSERGVSFNRSAKKSKLISILKEDQLSSVLRFLPATIHFDLSEREKENILSSFCRFKIDNEKGYELVKVFLNKTKGFIKKGNKLNQVCRERV